MKLTEADRELFGAEMEVCRALSKKLGSYTVPGASGVGICAAAIKIGHWDCETSPVEICVYDDWTDPLNDNCLYCHNPNERK